MPRRPEAERPDIQALRPMLEETQGDNLGRLLVGAKYATDGIAGAQRDYAAAASRVQAAKAALEEAKRQVPVVRDTINKENRSSSALVNAREAVDKLRKELDAAQKKASEYYDQLLRLKAEFENFRVGQAGVGHVHMHARGAVKTRTGTMTPAARVTVSG